MSEEWIVLNGISYDYPDGTNALDHITVSLQAGNTYVLYGPNGCGKSTLFRILTGLSYPNEGTYLFMNETIDRRVIEDKRKSKEFYRKIGFLFQNSETQLFCKTVEEEVSFGLFQLGLSAAEVKEKTEYFLKQVNMWEKKDRAPFHLSGGEKKRVALAAVLAMDPRVLIMDEPAAGLDEDGEAWMVDFLQKMNAPDRLIVIATHDKELAGKLRGTALYMNKSHQLVNG